MAANHTKHQVFNIKYQPQVSMVAEKLRTLKLALKYRPKWSLKTGDLSSQEARYHDRLSDLRAEEISS